MATLPPGSSDVAAPAPSAAEPRRDEPPSIASSAEAALQDEAYASMMGDLRARGQMKGRWGSPVGRAIQGALLALGAPLGWLAIRLLFEGELVDEPAVYVYLCVGTLSAFVIFGMMLGRREQEVRALNEQLARLSLTDGLTDLPNARFFSYRLPEALADSERHEEPLSLLVLDLDHFKRVNDRYGHAAGDQVLAAVGGVLAASTRRGETAARVGGEEFAILLPRADGEDALQVAERIRAAVEEMEAVVDGVRLPVTASIGMAEALPGELGSALYARADAALYRAKAAGRNRVVGA